MPGIITHYICGQAAQHAAEPEALKMIRPYQHLYNLGTQGPDVFFYYFPGLLKKHMRDLGLLMHKRCFGAFIGEMASFMLDENLPKDIQSVLFSYTSGFLTHYAMDVSAHPYVYFKTGTRQKGDRARAIKYSVNHRRFENAIDLLMLNLMSNKIPSENKLWQLIRVDAQPAQVAAGAVSRAIKNVYGRDVSPGDIHKAMSYMTNITRILQSRNELGNLMDLKDNLTLDEEAKYLYARPG